MNGENANGDDTSTKKIVDISKRTTNGKTCDLKCAYSYKYRNSVSTIKNNGINLSIKYDANMGDVIYNKLKYAVYDIEIYSPSLHLFNGRKVAGELIIVHNNKSGGNVLHVCVPIVQKTSATKGSDTLQTIIKYAGQYAPSSGDECNYTDLYNLGDFLGGIGIAYYTYDGNNVLDDNIGTYIVYDEFMGVSITQDVATLLSSILTSYDKELYFATDDPYLYLNSLGANAKESVANNDIYISCEPTGASEDEVEVTSSKNEGGGVSWDFLKTDAFKIFIKILIIVAICTVFFMIINVIYNYFGGSSVGNTIQSYNSK